MWGLTRRGVGSRSFGRSGLVEPRRQGEGPARLVHFVDRVNAFLTEPQLHSLTSDRLRAAAPLAHPRWPSAFGRHDRCTCLCADSACLRPRGASGLHRGRPMATIWHDCCASPGEYPLSGDQGVRQKCARSPEWGCASHWACSADPLGGFADRLGGLADSADPLSGCTQGRLRRPLEHLLRSLGRHTRRFVTRGRHWGHVCHLFSHRFQTSGWDAQTRHLRKLRAKRPGVPWRASSRRAVGSTHFHQSLCDEAPSRNDRGRLRPLSRGFPERPRLETALC